MSGVPVTGMNSKEYDRVFGLEPTPILDDEIILDVGSGMSRLDNVARSGVVIQVDPIYKEFSQDGHCARLPIRFGDMSQSSMAKIAPIESISITRVTMANTLRYLAREERILAIAQLLKFSVNGIAQIYPVNTKRAETLIGEVNNLGFGAIVQYPATSGPRQLLYRAGRINSVFTFTSQPKKVGPSDWKKAAKKTAETLFLT